MWLTNHRSLEVPTDDGRIIHLEANSITCGKRQTHKPLLGLFHRARGIPSRSSEFFQ
jgi:hypothetical protein